MKILELCLKNFRNYKSAKIFPHSEINLVVGPNAQGKTNLLEAISFLGSGRSPRTSKDSQLINWEENSSTIYAKIDKLSCENILRVFLKKNETGLDKTFYFNEAGIKKISDLFKISNIVFFSPQNIDLVCGPPKNRRNFLDSLIAKKDPSYLNFLFNYRYFLREKNSLLANSMPNQPLLETYTEKLIKSGSLIIKKRLEFLKEFSSDLALSINSSLLLSRVPEIKYISSIGLGAQDSSLEEIKNKFFQKNYQLKRAELFYKISLAGPHKDDILFLLNDKDMRCYSSFGEQLGMSLACRACETLILSKENKTKTILLLDDCFSSLDEKSSLALWSLLRDKGQVFFASTAVPYFLKNESWKRFKIKEGTILEENA